MAEGGGSRSAIRRGSRSIEQASWAVFGVRQEAFGIHEVRVAVDTQTSLCLVLLAKHEPFVDQGHHR